MAREPTNAERLVYGGAVQIDPASDQPIETGHGALPVDQQPQIVAARAAIAAKRLAAEAVAAAEQRLADDKAGAVAAQAKTEQDAAALAKMQNPT